MGAESGKSAAASSFLRKGMFSVWVSMEQTSKQLRKKKRFNENEFYAKEARYWSNYKTSTSTFLSDCHPKFVKTEKEALRKPEYVVYLVRARYKAVGIAYSFLKVGISGQRSIRFDFDSHRYSFATLALINCESRKDARTIESSLLKKFVCKKHIPKINLLSGGNSECFLDDFETEDSLKAAFTALGAVKSKMEPEIVVSPQIHNLLLMLDCTDYCGAALEERLRAFRGNLKSIGAKVPPIQDLFIHYTRKIGKKLT
jgi:hypothetical protein